jgi:broad specificity phosphatase PhoE
MAYIQPKHDKLTGLKVFLLRHAESLNNIRSHDNPYEYESLRSHDPDLSTQGYDQAAQLAAYLKQSGSLGDLVESKS